MKPKKKISESDIKHLAKLANLQLTDEEIIKYSDQLSTIVSYFQLLDEIDTSSVEPTFSTLGLKSVSRNDEVNKLQKIKSLKNLKTIRHGILNYFKVKRIL